MVRRLLLGCFLLALAACGMGGGAGGPQPGWPLRPGARTPRQEERVAELVHMELDLRIDPQERLLEGSVRHDLRVLRKGVAELSLMADGPRVERVVDGAGRELSFSADPPLLRILLPERLGPGDELQLELDYAVREPRAGLVFGETPSGDGGSAPLVFTDGRPEALRSWLPVAGHPDDRATISCRYRVPAGLEVVASGEPAEEPAEKPAGGLEPGEGDTAVHCFEVGESIPPHALAFVVGELESHVQLAGDTHVELVLPEGAGEEAALRAMGETAASLLFLEGKLGCDFPWARQVQVAVPGAPLALAAGAGVCVLDDRIVAGPEETLDLVEDPRLVVAHGIARQWFGNLLGLGDWHDLWLQEGWSSYLELLWMEEKRGLADFRLWLERYRHGYLSRGPETRLPMSISWFTAGPDVPPVSHVNTKGAWLLFMMHCQVGEDAFWRGARRLLEQRSHASASPGDLVRAFRETSGHDLTGWIEQWVEAGGHPVFEVDYVTRLAEEQRSVGPGGQEGGEPQDAVLVRVRQVQEFDRWVPLFDLPVTVDLHYADGRADRFGIQVRSPEELFRLPLDGELVDLVFDAECSLLCELQLDKGVEAWVLQALRDDPPAQWRALEGLEPFLSSSQPAREALGSLLRESPHELLRQRAAALAVTVRSLRPALLEAALEDLSPHVRRQAVISLGSRPVSEEEGTLLGQRLEVESSPATRAAIEELLGIEDASGPGGSE